MLWSYLFPQPPREFKSPALRVTLPSGEEISHFWSSLSHWIEMGAAAKAAEEWSISHSGAADLPSPTNSEVSSINSISLQNLGHLFSVSQLQHLPVGLTRHQLASPTHPHMTATSNVCLELSFYSDQSPSGQTEWLLLPSIVHLGYSCHGHVRAVDKKNEYGQQT